MALIVGLASFACAAGDASPTVPQPAAHGATPNASAPRQPLPEPIQRQAPRNAQAQAPAIASSPPPLADDPTANTAPSRDDLKLTRADADLLMAELQTLPSFPLRLSELEAHLGRPMRRYFNPESHDPTFVHDQGGQGANNGGTPIFHPSGDDGTPLLLELRSQHHARYDHDRRFRDRPPFAADDPVVDLISISDGYAHGAAPPVPADTLTFEGSYAYTGERWHIKPLHDGYVSLYRHDLHRNPGADRWVFEVTTERGFYADPAEIEQTEQTLLDFVEVIRKRRDMPAFLAEFERTHAAGYDYGILQLGLTSYNVRFFDTALTEGDHAGGFLRADGHRRALYINSYIEGDARVALPKFLGALGFRRYTVKPRHMPTVAPGNREGGLLYYNDVVLKKGGWRVSLTGFYPVKDGKAQSEIDLSKFLISSLTIRHAVPLRRKKT